MVEFLRSRRRRGNDKLRPPPNARRRAWTSHRRDCTRAASPETEDPKPGSVTAESEILQTPGYVVMVIRRIMTCASFPGRCPHLPERRPVAGRRVAVGRQHACCRDKQFSRDQNFRIHRRASLSAVHRPARKHSVTNSQRRTRRRGPGWSIDSLLPKSKRRSMSSHATELWLDQLGDRIAPNQEAEAEGRGQSGSGNRAADER
jgi:hypothetical protein